MRHLKKILIIIISITIITLFLWNDIKLSSYILKINDQKIANFATTIGAIISSITLYLLVKQLKLMDDTLHPDIYPVTTLLFYTPKGSNESPRIVHNGGDFYNFIEHKSETRSRDHYQPFLVFKNFGKGIALNCSLQWDYNKQEINTYLENESNIGTDWTISEWGENSVVPFLPSQSQQRIDAPYKYFHWVVDNKFSYNNPLKLTISYEDRLRNKKTKSFLIRILIDEDNKSIDLKYENL